MDNNLFNKNDGNAPETDVPENTESTVTATSYSIDMTSEVSVAEPVSNTAENTLGVQDKHNFIFSEDVTEDLLSEIFDDNTDKKKKKKIPKHKAPEKTNKTKPEKKKTFLGEVFDWVEIIVLSATFVLVLFTFVMRLAVVDGPSMENTLHHDEMLIISGLFYTPENNDIIVFNSPNFKEPIVKRVIAVEGQTVDIDFEKWQVTVDGRTLEEEYVKKALAPMRHADMHFPLTVPEGHVFVMGDNRNDSLDSRSSLIGLVDERYILGEVKIRLFPFNKFGKVD